MKTLSQNRLILMVAAIEFIYILDFMMVLPLGPDLAKAHQFKLEYLGWISAAFTFASVIAGYLSIKWLDRFDRRSALLLLLVLFTLSTGLTAFTQGLTSLLCVRILTGLLGGPIVAISFAILIDNIPSEQRGRAIGQVMLGFSLAAILGVPLVLELSRAGWQIPFLLLAGLSSALCLWISMTLPSMREHLTRKLSVSLPSLLRQPSVRLACVLQAASQFAAFLIIPYFSAYFLLNLGVARTDLGEYYAIGGVSAFLLVQLATRSNINSRVLVGLAILGFSLGLLPFWGWQPVPLLCLFAVFMASNAVRNVALASLNSEIPAPHERAGFMALQNIIQDLGMTVAAIVATQLIIISPNGQLLGLGWVAALSVIMLIFVLFIFVKLQNCLAFQAQA